VERKNDIQVSRKTVAPFSLTREGKDVPLSLWGFWHLPAMRTSQRRNKDEVIFPVGGKQKNPAGAGFVWGW
jgi:hypothetical protein